MWLHDCPAGMQSCVDSRLQAHLPGCIVSFLPGCGRNTAWLAGCGWRVLRCHPGVVIDSSSGSGPEEAVETNKIIST